ncbi:MAG: DNA-formamidopyrimidine glycosylase family protein [bacterium]
MPELPDLVYIEKILNKVLPGKKIIGVSITEPIVFRILIDQGVEESLRNTRFKSVFRHGPFLGFQ